MKTQQDIFDLITELHGNAGLIVIPREFIKITGDYETAALLAQLVYWTGKSQNEGWVYKTYQDWEDEIGLSKYKVNRARKTLENLGILETKLKKANGIPTLHYRINMKKLAELLSTNQNVSETDLNVKKLENGKLKNQQMESKKIEQWKVKN